jgi:glycosyltransferase involved in cell wall biosynthesis
VKVNLVAVSETLGGAELYLLNLADALGRAGVSASVVGHCGPVLSAAEQRGLAVSELRIGRKLSRKTALGDLARYPVARRRLHEFVRVEAASGAWTLLQFKWEQILWAGEIAPERACMLEHGPIPRRLLADPWARRRLQAGLRAAKLVAAVSRPAAEAIRSLCSRAPLWLPAGARQASGSGNGAVASWRRRCAPTGTLLAYAGRITRDKGVFEIAALPNQRPGLSVAIAGDGPDLEPLRHWIRSNGVADRVHLTGFVDDPVPLLEAADVTMLVSSEAGEGRPLAALESIGVGTPVIGLRSSPALRALATEFPSAVRLAETREAPELLAAVDAAIAGGCRPQPVGSWDETARTLLGAMEDGHAAR